MKLRPNFKIFLLILITLSARVTGRDMQDYAPGLGISLNGASGLFYIPSAQSLNAGHIRIGLLTGGSGLDTPYYATLGLSPKIEIYLSRSPKNQLGETIVNKSHLGTILNLLNWRKGILSVAMEATDIRYTSADTDMADHKLISGSFLAEYPLGNFRTILQLGVQERTFHDGGKTPGIRFGLASSRTLRNGIQGGLELLIDGPIPNSYQYTLAAGIKAFIMKHFQLGLVYSYISFAGQSSPGLVMTGAFSTSPFSSFKLDRSSSIWLDLKSLLNSFGLFDSEEMEAGVLPEFYVGPRDTKLPHPPALNLIRIEHVTDTTGYAYPEFHRPEKIKLLEPPPLEKFLSKNKEYNSE